MWDQGSLLLTSLDTCPQYKLNILWDLVVNFEVKPSVWAGTAKLAVTDFKRTQVRNLETWLLSELCLSLLAYSTFILTLHNSLWHCLDSDTFEVFQQEKTACFQKLQIFTWLINLLFSPFSVLCEHRWFWFIWKLCSIAVYLIHHACNSEIKFSFPF